ncbi:MAG: hypothetical protein IKB34_01640 [Clostridia bacterium]|nr:hypothetical protein [Clostridia bacterium]
MDEIVFSDLVDKIILIGITYYTADNELVEQKQLWGRVVEANEDEILVKLSNGELFELPPDLSSTKLAVPGEYRLRSTGELIVDPDYLSTWNVTLNAEDS